MSKSANKRRKPRRVMPAAALAARNVRLTRRPVVRLGTGETGFCMDPARVDDCLRPALATILQFPVEQLPDPRLDARLAAGDDPEAITAEAWAKFERWLGARGLRLAFHDTAPVRRRRWIGVVRPSRSAAAAFGLELADFADHCLVMAYDRILHDPAVSLPPPPGMRGRSWRPDDVVYGITLDKE